MPVFEELINKHGARKNGTGIEHHSGALTEKIKQFCLCKETVWNTSTAHMDSYPNPHQKSHSIHIQVIFQEITALCLYMYVFLSCKGFITLFCNYPNCASVYNNYKKFDRV